MGEGQGRGKRAKERERERERKRERKKRERERERDTKEEREQDRNRKMGKMIRAERDKREMGKDRVLVSGTDAEIEAGKSGEKARERDIEERDIERAHKNILTQLTDSKFAEEKNSKSYGNTPERS